MKKSPTTIRMIALGIILVLAVCYWWSKPAHVFCGGIAGLRCPSFGYTCTSEGMYPDAGTSCTKIFTR